MADLVFVRTTWKAIHGRSARHTSTPSNRFLDRDSEKVPSQKRAYLLKDTGLSIQRRRLSAQLTQKELADEANVFHTQLRDIELGKPVDKVILRKVMDACENRGV